MSLDGNITKLTITACDPLIELTSFVVLCVEDGLLIIITSQRNSQGGYVPDYWIDIHGFCYNSNFDYIWWTCGAAALENKANREE